LAKTPATNPIKAAYTRMIGAGNSTSSWDSVAMYHAGLGLAGLFANNTAPGSVLVDSVGGDSWNTSTVKPQHYLVEAASPSTISADVEKLIDQLPTSVTPPTSDPVAAYYAKLGAASSYLGNPVGTEYAPTSGGKAQNYQNGAIYWSGATGAHAVHGAILTRYLHVGGPASTLGYPITDETGTPDGIGRYNHFSRSGGASIYWSARSGAHAIYGAIRATWASLGWERSRLGYPITDEYSVPSGRRNDFQHGWITWNRTTGAITVGY
jgi:uncharacterized protein with LGFP repeats